MKVKGILTAICAFCLVYAGCGGRQESVGVGAIGKDAGGIELLRDEWGIPHVFAETDEGALYGLGYATAQDRAFQMYYNLRIIQGRLTTYELWAQGRLHPAPLSREKVEQFVKSRKTFSPYKKRWFSRSGNVY